MRILVSERGSFLALMEDGPLRRESLEVLPLAEPMLDRTLREGADLAILPRGIDSDLRDRLVAARVPVKEVEDAGDAADALEAAGVSPRRVPRSPIHRNAHLVTSSALRPGMTRDLSREGAFVCCRIEALERGERAVLDLPRREGRLRLSVRIVRVAEGEDYRVSGVGLAFEELDQKQVEGIEALLSRSAPPPRIPTLHYPG
jgi:hypothetical protein